MQHAVRKLSLAVLFSTLFMNLVHAANLDCPSEQGLAEPFRQLQEQAQVVCDETTRPQLALLEPEWRGDHGQIAYWSISAARCFQGVGDANLGQLSFLFKDVPDGLAATGNCAIKSLYDVGKMIVETSGTGYAYIGGAIMSKLGADSSYLDDMILANEEARKKTCIEESSQKYLEVAKIFREIFTGVRKKIGEEIDGFYCHPPTVQTYYICNALGQIVDPVLLASKAKDAAAVARRVTEVVEAVKKTMAAGVELARLGESTLVRKVDKFGKVYLEYRFKEKLPNGKWSWNQTEIKYHPLLGTIDGQEGPILREMIAYASTKAKVEKAFFLAIDVNFLRSVNYFEGGSAVGDAYLKAMSEAIHKVLRESDLLFRTGGDEFALVLKDMDEAQIQSKVKVINETISNHTALRGLFDKQVKFLEKSLERAESAFERASDLEGLPIDIQNKLTPAEAAFARNNFEDFKSTYLGGMKTRLIDTKKLMPSVSVGVAPIEGKSTLEGLRKTADNQIEKSKRVFYEKHGIPRSGIK